MHIITATLVLASLKTRLTFLEALSGITGTISLVAWIFLLIPQLFENYRRKSAEAVSLAFLFIWLVGDVANILGTIWAGLVPTIIAINVYFLISDVTLISQCVYYNTINASLEAVTENDDYAVSTPATEQAPLLAPEADRRRSSVASRRSHNPLLQERTAAQEWATNALSLAAIIALGTLGWFAAWKSQVWQPQSGEAGDDVPLIAELLGYLGAILFLGYVSVQDRLNPSMLTKSTRARTPQIYKNYKAKCCEGFSMLFPMIAMLGNITYALSVRLHLRFHARRSCLPFTHRLYCTRSSERT